MSIKVHGLPYCGYCGKYVKGKPCWGMLWRELPMLLFKEFTSKSPGAIIENGGALLVSVCSEECKKKYMQMAKEAGLILGKFMPKQAPDGDWEFTFQDLYQEEEDIDGTEIN